MKHEKRTYLFQYLDVLDQHCKQQLGFLADLSTDGLMFISQQLMPLNETKDICIENNLIPEGEIPVFIKAQIETLWIKPNINPEMHCIGCKFIHIDPDDYEQLEKLVSSLSFDPEMEVHRTKIINYEQ